MKEKTKKTLLVLLDISGIGIISAYTGFGMFWVYQLLAGTPVFFNILLGMFASALNSMLLTLLVLNHKVKKVKQ